MGANSLEGKIADGQGIRKKHTAITQTQQQNKDTHQHFISFKCQQNHREEYRMFP
jgi:hypothetical protein